MFLNDAITAGRLQLNTTGSPTSKSGGLGYIGTDVYALTGTDPSDTFIEGLRVTEDGAVRYVVATGTRVQNGLPLSSTGHLCVNIGAFSNEVYHSGIAFNDNQVYGDVI